MTKIVLTLLCFWAAIISVECDPRFCEVNCLNTTLQCMYKEKTREECEIKNTGCTDNGKFDASCVKPERIQLNDAMKQAFLDAHNEKRNLIAGGQYPNFGPACHMASMQWDDDLAEVAAALGRRCKMEHDTCRRTKKFANPGQNLFMYYVLEDDKYPDYVFYNIKYSVDSWFSEINQTKPRDMESFPDNFFPIGHFAAVVNELNTHVGCAIVTFNSDPKSRNLIIVCNYARMYGRGFTIISKCNPPGKNCTTGLDKKYPNLCSTREQYDVNHYSDFDVFEWNWDKKA